MRGQSPTVLILAAGRGTRFVASGGQGFKLDALVLGKSVLGHTLDAVRSSGLAYHVEAGPHAGMGDSIAAAVRATVGSPGWLILPGDLPLIRSHTLVAVAEALRQGAIVVPLHHHRRGHPVGFPAACGPALIALSGCQGAAAIVKAVGCIELPTADAGCVSDIDTVQDLEWATTYLTELQKV